MLGLTLQTKGYLQASASVFPQCQQKAKEAEGDIDMIFFFFFFFW